MNNKIDKIILGHNQFYGTDHLDADRGDKRAIHFSSADNVLKVIEWAIEEGAGGLMLSTHPNVNSILNNLRKNDKICSKLNFYPNLPYIAKYVRQSNEKGIIPMINEILQNSTLGEKLSFFLKGGSGFLSKDLFKLMETLFKIEMLPFKGLPVKAIFLHNALTDLALGLKSRRAFEYFMEFTEKNFNAIPAFTTANLPLFIDTFEEWGIKNPLVMASFNKIGYTMNPDLKTNEECLKNKEVRLLAMGTLASGYLKPDEAFKYLYTFKNVESVVVGVSSKDHIQETFGAINKYSN